MVSAWVEEWHECPTFRIDTGDVRAFVKVAKAASQSQVIGLGGTAMLTSDDVLYVKAGET